MATDNRAYGLALGPETPMFYAGQGVSTPFGIHLPPGGKVAAYLRSGGVSDQDPTEIQNRLVTTLAAALRYVRAGRGDTIVVLPGHSENVTDATMLDNLVAGTRILGCGHGSLTPTFRWTNTAGQWTVDQANVVIQGLRLRMEGANGVVKAVIVTGPDSLITGCDIETASGATAKATIAVEYGATSDRGAFIGNRVRGTAGHNSANVIKIVSAVSDIAILRNQMFASATSANGLIQVTAAALGVMIGQNVLMNSMTTAALVAIDLGTTATTGMIWDNRIGVLTGGAMVSGTHGISFGGSADYRIFENYISDSANGGGITVVTAAA